MKDEKGLTYVATIILVIIIIAFDCYKMEVDLMLFLFQFSYC